MSILVRFTPPSLTAQQYDETIRKIEEQEDPFPPDGLDLHVCFGTEPNLRVSDVWDSREQFDAFGERLMPFLEQEGIDPGEPELIDVHNVIRR